MGACTHYIDCGHQNISAAVLHTVLAGGQHTRVGSGDSVLECGAGDEKPGVSIQSSYHHHHHHAMLYPCNALLSLGSGFGFKPNQLKI